MKKILPLLALLAMILAGCGGKMDRTVVNPTERTPNVSKTFDLPYDKVWKATVDALAESFWSLDNIEKDSGILTLSCVFERPADWIDCGTTHHRAHFNTLKQDITYETASSPQTILYVVGEGFGSRFDKVYRTVTASAKSNVVVKKIGANKTLVTVNTNNVLTLEYKSFFGPHGLFPKTSDTMTFNNKGFGSFDSLPESMICRSKNTFEQQIFDAIEKKLR